MEQRNPSGMLHWRLFLKYALHFLIMIALKRMKQWNLKTVRVLHLDDPLSSEELKYALNSIRKNSPGLNQISYKMLEQIPIEFETYLLSIFNEIFSKGVFPHSWKSSLMVFIPKPGSKAIRFISLMSCVCKLWSVSYTKDWGSMDWI